MPIHLSRRLAGRERTPRADWQLGCLLAFIAGATNAGGFLAVHQYTSHMTGIVSAMADNLALGTYDLVLGGIGALLSFVVGAGVTAVLVNHARRRQLRSVYALPLILEAALLLCFGTLGARLSEIDGLFVPVTVMLLSFIMGLQNALITKLSRAEIRTTHITGIVTDIGIELGKLFYWNARRSPDLTPVTSNRRHLAILSMLAASFFTGGVVGALGFKYAGYIATVPLALALVAVAIVPAVDDLIGMTRSRSAR
jgi:uncharacterized membrane protein YoaK (UPF0700 family)